MAFLSSKAKRRAISDDVSRLLDPQYSPQSKTNPLHHLTLIRDQDGDFHDPDYRPFTPISRPQSQSPRRHPSPRPYWETISMTEDELNDDDDDDDACDERRLSDGYAYSSRYAHRRSSGQYRRDNRYSYSYAHSYTPSYSYSPSTFAEYSSPPNSYDSETTVLGDEPFGEKEKQGWTGVLRLRRKDKGKEIEHEETREDDEQDIHETEPATKPESPVAKRQEYTPTCGEAFQRQWQTLCLAFNISLFRAQRRMKHRVNSLMSTH